MTDFMVDGTSGDTSTVGSPISGQLTFERSSGASLSMNRHLANDTSWWNNVEADYTIYTTDVTWIKILLPENTRAFSFNVGAELSSTGLNAWLKASETGGDGVEKTWFNVNKTNTPGFGIYSQNVAGQCSAITSVTIDPILWGVGNFSINQDDNCAVNVPEPPTSLLFGLGMMGLLFSWHNAKKRTVLKS